MDISKATLEKMAGQPWYFAEELVASVLLDNGMNNVTKDKNIVAMKE